MMINKMFSFLYSCLGEGDISVPELLIERGAQVNVLTEKRETPLHWV
jgi:hypothetical protein